MVYLLLGCLALFYLLMALRFFTVWLAVFRQDSSVSAEESLGSMVIIVLMTISWPFVVPFAYLELLNTQEKVESLCMTCNQLTTAEEESTQSDSQTTRTTHNS